MIDLNKNISRVAFIFLIFTVVASGYLHDILSCQLREFLQNSIYARHVLGIIMIFVFIMLEGGWSFSEEEEEDTSWLSGNTIHSFGYALILYIIFIVSAKSKLIPNIIFFSLLFILYFVNTYRIYMLKKEGITEEVSENILFIEHILIGFVVITLIYSFYEYLIDKLVTKGTRFSWHKFLLGTGKCKGLKE